MSLRRSVLACVTARFSECDVFERVAYAVDAVLPVVGCRDRPARPPPVMTLGRPGWSFREMNVHAPQYHPDRSIRAAAAVGPGHGRQATSAYIIQLGRTL